MGINKNLAPINFARYDALYGIKTKVVHREGNIFIKSAVRARVNRKDRSKNGLLSERWCVFCNQYRPICEFFNHSTKKVCRGHQITINKHDMQKMRDKNPFEAVGHKLSLEYHRTIQQLFGEQCELYARCRNYVRSRKFTARDFIRIAESLNSTYDFTGSPAVAWGVLLETPDQIEGIRSVAILPKHVTSAITRVFRRTATLDAYTEAVRAAFCEHGLPYRFINNTHTALG